MAKVAYPLAVAALALAAATPSHAQTEDIARYKSIAADAKKSEAAARAGAKVATFCANCHGEGGNSSKPEIPNLAGQHPQYLLDVMHQYESGRRPTTEFKQRLIKAMTADERVNMVLFYSKQPVIRSQARDPALVKKGKDLYAKECADCHDDDGRGTDKYARVAGQQVEYMTASLKSYRDGKRSKASRQMSASVEGMTDAQIGALAAYIATMD